MKERYFDNQRFKKLRFVEIGIVVSLILLGGLLFMLEEGTEITENMLLALVLVWAGVGYTLPIFTEMFYIRKTGNKI